MYGVNPTWGAQTNEGRTHIATKGIVQSGLVLNLDAGVLSSYPGSGTTWTDLSGNGNHGTFTNMDGTNFNSANGGSLTFDGSNEGVSISASSSLGKSINYTTSAWMKYSGGTYLMILDSVDYGVGGGYMMWLQINTPKLLTSYDGQFQSSTGTIPLNTWANVCISKSNNQLSFYINGSFDVTRTFSFNGNTSSTAVDIGYSSRNTGNPFNGNIAQVSIYNRALTATEIQQNYLATKSRYFS